MVTNDYIIFALYAIGAFILAFIFFRKQVRWQRNLLLLALLMKIVVTYAYCYLYTYHYQEGDARSYYAHGERIREKFIENPKEGIAMFLEKGSLNMPADVHKSQYVYWADRACFTVVRSSFLVGLTSFRSFLVGSLMYSLFAFIGLYAIFRLYLKYFPKSFIPIYIACLAIPSVLFWSSGISKDALVLGSLGLFIFFVEIIFVQNKKKVLGLTIVVLAAILILLVKPYVLLLLMAPLSYFLIVHVKNKFALSGVKVGLALGCCILLLSISLLVAAQFNDRFAINNYITEIADLQRGNYDNSKDEGSAYYLGKIEPTLKSVVKKIPGSAVVSLFRPFIWEAKNALMLVTSFETFSFTILLLCSLTMVKMKIVVKYLFHPLIMAMFIYGLLYFVLVGLTSYNFGALSRFKVQAYPMIYIVPLIILFDKFKPKLQSLFHKI